MCPSKLAPVHFGLRLSDARDAIHRHRDGAMSGISSRRVVVRRISRWTLAASIAVGTACAHARTSGALSRTVGVDVDNQYATDVRVYLVRGETPIFLGSVGSFERRTFRLGPELLPLLAAVRLRVRAMDGSMFSAPPMMVDRGHLVLWRLGPRLELSTIAVR